jgi:hypothetical protein
MLNYPIFLSNLLLRSIEYEIPVPFRRLLSMHACCHAKLKNTADQEKAIRIKKKGHLYELLLFITQIIHSFKDPECTN